MDKLAVDVQRFLWAALEPRRQLSDVPYLPLNVAIQISADVVVTLK